MHAHTHTRIKIGYNRIVRVFPWGDRCVFFGGVWVSVGECFGGSEEGTTYIYYDSLVQEALLLCGHHKVVSVVLIVHYVLQIDTCIHKAQQTPR